MNPSVKEDVMVILIISLFGGKMLWMKKVDRQLISWYQECESTRTISGILEQFYVED